MNLEVPPRVLRVARWAGYPLFYLLALLVCVRCTFPYNRIGQKAAATYNAAEAGKSGRRLEIDWMGGYWLFGVRASKVRFIGAPPPPDDEGKSYPARVAELDSAYAAVSPLRYLFGSTRVKFGASAEDGSFNGRFDDAADERAIRLELTQMGVEHLPLLADMVGIPMLGQGNGTIELLFPKKRLSLTEGKIELSVDNLEIGDGKTKIRGFIALPKLQAGRLELVAEVQEGRIKIDKLEARGPDFELDMAGQIRLRDRFEQSIADLTMRFKFADSYKTRNDMTRGLFGDPQKKIKGALDFDPKVSRAKEADGSYSWRISGPFGQLAFQPAPGGAAPAGARTKRPGRSAPAAE